MLENYERLPNGVIRQINKKPFVYDLDYTKTRYDSLGEANRNLCFLRLGYVIGVIGFVPESILDYGCGNGEFLHACSTAIPICHGYDVVDSGIGDFCKIMPTTDSKYYSIVTFFDSIEHVEKPEDEIKKLNTDYIVVSVPNCIYPSDEWFASWKHRKPDEHLWHFNESALTNFFMSLGYTKVNSCHIEDSIRKGDGVYPNILTCVFTKS